MGSVVASEPGEAVVVARLRRGVVGETRRVSHLVPVPTGHSVPDELAALCGAALRRGESEWLATFTGMPCERCLSLMSARRSARVLLPAS